jgi:hypothetical protein
MPMRILVTLVIFSIVSSCTDEEPVVKKWRDPLEGLPDKGPLRFDEPAIGQRSYFVSFRATNDFTTEEVQYEYVGDTLVLAITGKQSDYWILNEFITQGSSSRLSLEDDSVLDSVYVTTLRIDSDSVYFGDPSGKSYFSNFFGIPANSLFKLSLALVTESAKENPTCSPFLSRNADSMEFSLNYIQLGQTYVHLNVYGDNSMTATDGPALMYVYAPSYGFVRMSAINPWVSDRAAGWDLTSR